MKRTTVFDLTSKKIGRWSVVNRADNIISRGRSFVAWECLCSCGEIKIVTASSLLTGRSNSCGCLRTEMAVLRKTKHGQGKKGAESRAYRSWSSMKTRCLNPKSKFYSHYGGRGIEICPEWVSSFESFFRDMGMPEKGLTIEREDNNLGYFKGNCKWVPRKIQNRNKRTNRILNFQGKEKCLSEWSEETKLKRETISNRLDAGWSVEKALQTPARKYGG
jgi:hypothetical protein